MKNQIGIRLSDDEAARLYDAAKNAGLPVSTFARVAIMQSLGNDVLVNLLHEQEIILNRHEKTILEILRREVLGLNLLYNKYTEEVSSSNSKAFIAEWFSKLNQEA